MSPVKRLASKRKATTSRPSSSSPQIHRERPSLEFSKKEIAFEKVFPTYDLDKRAECRWTMDYLGRNNYWSITTPFADDIYPRLVKLFYQRLRYGSTEDGEMFIEFTVDGHHGRITTSDLGIITKLPAVYSDTLIHLKPPFVFPDDESVIEYILGDFGFNNTKGSGESIKVSTLPENVWLLDRILKENIYPLGHHGERRTYLLLALYSAHEGHFYSIPHLLMLGITKISQELKNKSSSGKAAPLPYGFLISAILRYTEYFLDDNEPTMDIETLYPLDAWVFNYNQLLAAKKNRLEGTQWMKTPTGKNSAPGIFRTFTPEDEARFTRLEKQQDDIFCRQGEICNQLDDMHLLLKVMARRQLGDGIEQLVHIERQRPPCRYHAPPAAMEEDEETNSDWE